MTRGTLPRRMDSEMIIRLADRWERKDQIMSIQIYQNTIDAQGDVSFLLFANKFSIESIA